MITVLEEGISARQIKESEWEITVNTVLRFPTFKECENTYHKLKMMEKYQR